MSDAENLPEEIALEDEFPEEIALEDVPPAEGALTRDQVQELINAPVELKPLVNEQEFRQWQRQLRQEEKDLGLLPGGVQVPDDKLGLLFKYARPKDGNKYRAIVALSDATGIPENIIEQNYEEFARSVEEANRDPEKWRKQNESLHQMLVEGENKYAGLVLEDETLSNLSANLRLLGELTGLALTAVFGDKTMQELTESGESEELLRPIRQSLARLGKDSTLVRYLLPKQMRDIAGNENIKPRQVLQEKSELGAGAAQLDAFRLAYDVQTEYSRAGRELARLNMEALAAERSGDAELTETRRRLAYEKELEVRQLERELAPKQYQVDDAGQFLVEAMQGVGSSLQILTEGAKGAAIAAGVGAAAGGLVTRTPAGAKKGAKIGAKVGGLIWGTKASYDLQFGPTYMELYRARNDDGTPLDPEIVYGAASLVTLAKTALEMGDFFLDVKAWGLDMLLKTGTKKALEQAAKKPLQRSFLKEIGRRQAAQLLGEPVEEAGQEVADIVGEVWAKYKDTGSAPDVNLVEAAGGVAQAAGAGFQGALVMGAASGPTSIAVGKAARTWERSVKNSAILRQVKKTLEKQEHNIAYVDRLIEIESQKHGDVFKSAYVDPQAVVDAATAAPRDTKALLEELLGPDAQTILEDALANRLDADGGRATLEIPLEDFRSKWAKNEITEKLLDHMTLYPWHFTAKEQPNVAKEIDAQAKAIQAQQEKRDLPSAPLLDQLAEEKRQVPEGLEGEYYRDRNSGLLNERGRNLLPPDPSRPLWVRFTIPGKKPTNDKFFHEAVDGALRKMSEALPEMGIYDGVMSGANPHARVASPEQAQQIAQAMAAKLDPEGRVPVLFAVAEQQPGEWDATGMLLGQEMDRVKAEAGFSDRETLPEALAQDPEVFKAIAQEWLKASEGDAKPASQLSPEHREAFSTLAPEDAAYSAYHAPSGLLNELGFRRAREINPRKYVLTMDLRAFGAFNEIFSRHGTDAVNRLFAEIIQELGGGRFDFAHLHGDEYAAQTNDKEALQEFMVQLETVLNDRQFLYIGVDKETKKPYIGVQRGVPFAFGIAEDTEALSAEHGAENELIKAKAKQDKTGFSAPEKVFKDGDPERYNQLLDKIAAAKAQGRNDPGAVGGDAGVRGASDQGSGGKGAEAGQLIRVQGLVEEGLAADPAKLPAGTGRNRQTSRLSEQERQALQIAQEEYQKVGPLLDMSAAEPPTRVISKGKKKGQTIEVRDIGAQLDELMSAIEPVKEHLQKALVKEELAETERLRSKEYKAFREKAQKEYEARKDVQAWRLLRNGSEATGPIRLNREDFEQALQGLEDQGNLPNRLIGRIVNEDGMTVAEFAELAGYDSAQTLLEAWAGMQTKKDYVKDRAEELYQQAHPELDSRIERLRKEAQKAYHQDDFTQKVVKQYGKLLRLAGLKEAPWQAIRQYAERIVSRRKIGRLDISNLQRQELAASQASAAAFARGDYATATRFWGQRLLAHFQWKALNKAVRQRDQFRALLKDSRKRKRREVLEGAGAPFLAATDAILQQIGEPAQPQTSLGEALVSLQVGEDPIELSVNTERLKALKKKSWKDLTVEEMNLVTNALKELYFLANDQNSIEDEGRRKQLSDIATAIANEAAYRPLQKINKGSRLKAWWHLDTQPRVLAQRMGETFTRVVWDATIEGEKTQLRLTKKVLARFLEIDSTLTPEMQKNRFKLLDEQLPMPAGIRRIRQDRVFMYMVALNVGNAGNLQRLTDGYQWDPKDVMAWLDKHMEKEEWDFVQGIWDLLENDLRPEAVREFKKERGITPEMVEATPIKTRHGVYRGGYFPAKYDSVSSRQALQQRDADSMSSFKAGQTSVRRSFMRPRAEKNVDLINLDWSVLPLHMGQVVHYISYATAVRQMSKVMNNRLVDQTGKERLGVDAWDTLVNKDEGFIAAVANPFGFQGKLTEKGLRTKRWLRGVLSYTGIGFNVTSSILMDKFTVLSRAFAPPISRIHPWYLAGALARADGTGFIGFARMRKFALENSPHEVAARADHSQRELLRLLQEYQNPLEDLEGDYPKVRKLLQSMNKAQELSYVVHDWSDAYTTTITWNAAYREAHAKTGSHEQAVAHAEKVLAAAMPPEKAHRKAPRYRLQSLALDVIFGTFWNQWANEAREHFDPAMVALGNKRYKKAAGLGIAAIGMYLGQAAVHQLISEAVGGRGRDEDEPWDEYLFRKLATGVAYTVNQNVGVVVEGAINEALDRPTFGDISPRSPSASGAGIIISRFRKALEEGNPDRAWAVLELIGTLGAGRIPFLGSGQEIKARRYLTEGDFEEDVIRGRPWRIPGGLIHGPDKK